MRNIHAELCNMWRYNPNIVNDSYVWTDGAVQGLLRQKWRVALSFSRIYELLHELGLSHQRAHRDYGPSSATERAAFVAQVNAELDQATPEAALVCMDEFALQSVPPPLTPVEDKAKRVRVRLAQGPPFTPRQMTHIWRHIGHPPKAGGF